MLIFEQELRPVVPQTVPFTSSYRDTEREGPDYKEIYRGETYRSTDERLSSHRGWAFPKTLLSVYGDDLMARIQCTLRLDF